MKTFLKGEFIFFSIFLILIFYWGLSLQELFTTWELVSVSLPLGFAFFFLYKLIFLNSKQWQK